MRIVIVILLLFLLSACGSKPSATPSATSGTPGTPQPAQTATASETPTLANSPSVYDQLDTAAANRGLTRTVRALSATPKPSATASPTATPTLNLPLRPARAVTPDPLAIDAQRAGQLEVLYTYGDGDVRALAWSQDGRYLAAATTLGVELYDAASFELVRRLETEAAVKGMAFRPEGQYLALALGDQIEIWDINLGQRVRAMAGFGDWSVELIYGKEDRLAGSGHTGYDENGNPILAVRFWNAASGQVIDEEQWLAEPYYLEAGWLLYDLDPATNTLVYRGKEGITLRNLSTGEIQVVDFIGYAGELVFSPDGKNIVYEENWLNSEPGLFSYPPGTGLMKTNPNLDCGELLRSAEWIVCIDGLQLNYLDPQTLDVSLSITLPASDPIGLNAVDAAGRLAWVEQGNLVVLDQEAGGRRVVRRIARDGVAQTSVGMLDLGGRFRPVAASANLSGDLRVRDLESGTILAEIAGRGERIMSIVFSPDLSSLAWLDETNTVTWWDLISGQALFAKKLNGTSLVLTFSPDNRQLFLVAHSANYIPQIFELDLTHSIVRLIDESAGYFMVYDNNNYKPFLTNELDETYNWGWAIQDGSEEVVLTNLDDGERILLPFRSPGGDAWDWYEPGAAAMRADGRYLAVGFSNGYIVVWDIPTRQVVQIFGGHERRGGDGWAGAIVSLQYAPGTNLLVSSGYDATTRLWNASNGMELRRLKTCCSAGFTPDGKYLVTAGAGVMRVWGIK